MIRILKASAGSGKTFQLAKTYIALLMAARKATGDRNAHRHILAVTFTNKATGEMKSRILKELDLLSRNPSASGYLEDFKRMFGSEETISAWAADALGNILHDYSAFSVSTIDKFFQQTLKAFAREIGQFASYQVELDKKALIHESVDRVLDALKDDGSAMLEWLTDSAMDQLNNQGTFHLEAGLYEMAENLKSDQLREVAQENGLDPEAVFSKESLARTRQACRRVRQDFIEAVHAAVKRISDVFEEAGVNPYETSYKFMGLMIEEYGSVTLRKPVRMPGKRMLTLSPDPSLWFSAAKSKKYLPLLQGRLEEPLSDFFALFETPYKAFLTAGLIQSKLYDMGIATELFAQFNTLQQEKNILCIDDSNLALGRIIAGSDAPFVYEKLGVRYEHFLLDEFQDTSTIQWENFRPLLRESESSGQDSLIVGDIKQSIYRFRGGDWNLLGSKVKEDFPRADDTDPLQDNWRSLPEIVAFNNAFFQFAAPEIDRFLGEDRIAGIYADAVQRPRVGEAGQGKVTCTFCPAESVMDEVLQSVRFACGEGHATPGQIAVLVRDNKTGAQIAARLNEDGWDVVSDDSLDVKSSVTVRQVVSLLSYVDNPADEVGSFLARSLEVGPLGQYTSLLDLCEELLRRLRAGRPDGFGEETPYIQAFMDYVLDWTAAGGHSLSAFLKDWEGRNPKISSPQDSNAIRVITVHKAKGLEYPYVIFPYPERVGLFKEGARWSRPQTAGTALEGKVEGVFPVVLQADSAQTLFSAEYEQERLLQAVDNLNVFYVALTRAEKGLHVISGLPAASFRTACEEMEKELSYSDLSQVLYAFLCRKGASLGLSRESVEGSEDEPEREEWTRGSLPDFSADADQKGHPSVLRGDYPSYPLNPQWESPEGEIVDVRERGRLKFSTDAVEFFREEGPSNRLRGIVLHDLLSRVYEPEDLETVLVQAQREGLLTPSQREAAEPVLRQAISVMQERDWFPERSAVRNEVSLISAAGQTRRPDRVVQTPGGVVVIDYKFGAPQESYRHQVRQYMQLYREMGHAVACGALLYLDPDGKEPPRIEEV